MLRIIKKSEKETEEAPDQVDDLIKSELKMNEDRLTGIVDGPNGRLAVNKQLFKQTLFIWDTILPRLLVAIL